MPKKDASEYGNSQPRSCSPVTHRSRKSVPEDTPDVASDADVEVELEDGQRVQQGNELGAASVQPGMGNKWHSIVGQEPRQLAPWTPCGEGLQGASSGRCGLILIWLGKLRGAGTTKSRRPTASQVPRLAYRKSRKFAQGGSDRHCTGPRPPSAYGHLRDELQVTIMPRKPKGSGR